MTGNSIITGPNQLKVYAARLALAVIVIVTLARLFVLSADPSSLVSTAHITDEGWWSQNARNHYLFGQWIMDEHNPALVMTPAYTIVQRLLLGVTGSSFAGIRLVSALSVVATVFLVAVRLRFDRRWSLAASLLLAVNPFLFAYSRIAFVEPFQLFALAGCWFFSTGSRQRSGNAFLSGLFAVVAVAAKPTAAPVALICLLAPWLNPVSSNARSRLRFSLAVVGGGLVSLAAFFFFLLPHWSTFLTELSRESRLIGGSNGFSGLVMPLLLGLADDGGRLHTLPGYWLGIAPLFLLSALLLLGHGSVARNQISGDEGRTVFVFRVTTAWLVLGLITLMLQSPLRSNPRYWLNLLVPVSVLLASPVVELQRRHKLTPVLAGLLGCFAVSMLFRGQYLTLIYTGFPQAGFSATVVLLAILVLAGTGIIWGARRLFAAGPLPIAGVISGASATAGVAVVVLWAVFSASLLIRPTFTIRDASRSIARELELSSAVLTGRIANTLALETNLFAYETRDLAAMRMGTGVLNDDPEALGATHIVSTVEVEGDIRAHDYPLHATFEPVMQFGLVPDGRYPSGYRYVGELAALQRRVDAHEKLP